MHSEQAPLTAVVQLAQAPTQTVTIIQTAVTSGRDPWAALREQYGKPKRRRKRPQTLPDAPDLWSFAASSPSASLQDASHSQTERDVPIQDTLW